MNAQDIFVDHLRHALQQLQRYLAFGFTAALMLLVLAASPSMSSGSLLTPMGHISVNAPLARALLIAILFGTSALAYATILDAQRLSAKIEDEAVRFAALAFPSVATSSDPPIRLLGPLAPAIAYAVFLFMDDGQAFYRGFGLFPIVLYAGVAYEAYKHMAPVTTPPPAIPK